MPNRTVEQEPINGELDPGIADVVELLRAHGFKTFSSCQGGEGHAFSQPTVMMHPTAPSEHIMLQDRSWLAKVLVENGYSGFYIALVWAYQSDVVAWDEVGPYLELEFWVTENGSIPRK